MKVKITADSACDMPKYLVEKHNISIIPFSIIMGDEEYKDGVSVTPEQLIDYAKNNKELPKTSAINQMEYDEFFKQFLDGDTEIVHFSLSSGISVTCTNAQNAAKEVGNTYVVDGKSLSSGTALLILKACEMAEDGKSAKEIYDAMQALVEKVQASFVVEKVDFLRKGGRCSMLAALGANLLKIKPTLILKNGKIISDKKFIGKQEEVIKKYVAYILEKFPNPDLSRVFVTHSPCPNSYAEIAKEALKDVGFKEVIEAEAGATICTHCGAGTLGILYLCK